MNEIEYQGEKIPYTLVKSKIIRDKNANNISDFMFDLLSIFITIFLIINIFL